MDGALKPALTALKNLYGEVNAALPPDVEPLRVYRWRPMNPPDLPAVWNWFPTDKMHESDLALKDIANHRDTFYISAYIAVTKRDAEDDMELIEDYVDAFRAVVDPALNKRGCLDNTVVRAQRLGMRPAIDDFNQIEIPCLEFPLELWLQRILNP